MTGAGRVGRILGWMLGALALGMPRLALAAPLGGGKSNPAGLLLGGPLLLLLLLSAFALVLLLAHASGRAGALIGLCRQAARRPASGRGWRLVWGIAASVLSFVLAAILVRTGALALLGLLVGLAGMALAGAGTGVAAVRLGRGLFAALGYAESGLLPALCLGLAVFFLAEWIPFLGSLVVGLAGAAGMGAVLEALLGRAD